LSITKKIETTRMNASMLLLSALQSGDESRFIAVLDSIEINDLISMRDPTTDATLLHVAADRSLERAIDALLGGKFKNSSLVRAQTREGNIALHFAVRKSGACAAQLLAAWPESLNFLCVNRESPLLYACNAACRSSVALLVSDAFRANVNWFHVAKSGRNCLVALVCASVKSEMSSDAIECIRTIFDNLDDSARRGLLLWTERSRSHSICTLWSIRSLFRHCHSFSISRRRSVSPNSSWPRPIRLVVLRSRLCAMHARSCTLS
jgi:hypothetical protein